MPVRRREDNGRWYFRAVVRFPDGRKLRVRGQPGRPGPYHDLPDTKAGAIEAERRALARVVMGKPVAPIVDKPKERGAAAARYLETLRSKPATEIVVGDVVWFDGAGITRSEWFTVETAEVKETSYTAGGEPRTQVDVRIAGTGRKSGGPMGMHVAPTSLVRVAQTAEGKAATYAQALAYQAELTKAGTPRKR